MIQVKICGITSVEDARGAVEAGADAVGLNFVPGTPRALDEETAREISAAVAGRAVRVGVFQDAPLERVTGLDVPMPYALNLEDKVLPTEERVIDAVKRVSYAK